MKSTLNQRQFVKSLSRGFNVLTKVCESDGPLSLSELAKESNLSIGAIQRLSYTLENMGILDRDQQTKKFRVGPKMISLALTISQNLELRKVALPYMQTLSDQVEEVVGLGALTGNQIILVEIIHTRQLLNINMNIGAIIPPHATATGKAILAFLSDAKMKDLLPLQKLKKYTSNTITSMRVLKSQLNEVKTQGFSIAFDENANGLSTIGAPIRNHNNDVVASLTIMVPSMKMPKDRLVESFKNKVIDTADQISSAMGYHESVD
jgi:DNA-binding IclR family transcriptional regulator